MKHKHYDALVGFANGEKIQVRPQGEEFWRDLADPIFSQVCEYRVKPKEYPKSALTDNELVSKYFNGGNVDLSQEYQAWRRIANEAIKHFIESGEMAKYFMNPENGFVSEGSV